MKLKVEFGSSSLKKAFAGALGKNVLVPLKQPVSTWFASLAVVQVCDSAFFKSKTVVGSLSSEQTFPRVYEATRGITEQMTDIKHHEGTSNLPTCPGIKPIDQFRRGRFSNWMLYDAVAYCFVCWCQGLVPHADFHQTCQTISLCEWSIGSNNIQQYRNLEKNSNRPWIDGTRFHPSHTCCLQVVSSYWSLKT